MKTLKRIGGWWKGTGGAVFKAPDSILGAAAGLLVGLVSEYGRHVQDNGVLVLVTLALLGAGLLAIVLAALAILVTFFDDHFRQVIAEAPGGVDAAMLPYKTVALLGALGAAVATVGAIVWSSAPHWLRATMLGIVSLALVWAVVGTYQLVWLTVFFGTERSKLMEGIARARGSLEQRRRSA